VGLGLPLCTDVGGGPVGVGSERAQLHKAFNTARLGGTNQIFGAVAMHLVVHPVATFRLEQRRERDKVDNGVVTRNRRLDRVVGGDVTADSLNGSRQRVGVRVAREDSYLVAIIE